jgi:hypothetical protein
MMRYIITESKLNSLIYDFLTSNYYPDYNWGPELHDFYREDVSKYGYFDFMINDGSAFDYSRDSKTLGIRDWVYENLDDLFGDLWEPIFVKWFENNSGLPVGDLIRYRSKKKEFNEIGPNGPAYRGPEGYDDSRDAYVDEEVKRNEITERCWKGYTQKGMKTMFGKRYPNCVKKKK